MNNGIGSGHTPDSEEDRRQDQIKARRGQSQRCGLEVQDRKCSTALLPGRSR